MDEEPSEYIDFIAKYKDWVAIKRMGIRSATKPQEIAYHLAGISAAMERRDFALLGINTALLDSTADKLTADMKRSYDSLATAVQSISSADAKKALSDSCPDKSLIRLAESYLLRKVIRNLGFDTGMSQLSLSKIYKELKPPRMPGRKPKA